MTDCICINSSYLFVILWVQFFLKLVALFYQFLFAECSVPRVGLIEWMSSTCPLKDFLMDALTDEERKFFNDRKTSPMEQHGNWVQKFVPKSQTSLQKCYDALYMKCSAKEAVQEFSIKEGKIPWNLSRLEENIYICLLLFYSPFLVNTFLLSHILKARIDNDLNRYLHLHSRPD